MPLCKLFLLGTYVDPDRSGLPTETDARIRYIHVRCAVRLARVMGW